MMKRLPFWLVLLALLPSCGRWEVSSDLKSRALKNGTHASEALIRSRAHLFGWLAEADSATGLIPRNLNDDRDLWNATDAAAIESVLNLYNREQVADVDDWIDGEIQVMWAKQQDSGIIEGRHGDGNFVRTSLMYGLWKSVGIVARPWREDVKTGAVIRDDGDLFLSIQADSSWAGTLVFDSPRARTQMNLPMDWPRSNQFPEWYVVDASAGYAVHDLSIGASRKASGRELLSGLSVSLTNRRPSYYLIEHGPVR